VKGSILKSLKQLKGHLMKIRTPYELEVHLRKTPSQTGYKEALFVVVYNNVSTFTNCFASSPFIQLDKVFSFHNLKNEGLPAIFNRVIREHLNDNIWLIFCHQDFIFKEDILLRLKDLDINTIYGPIGVRRGDNRFYGQIVQTANLHIGMPIAKPTLVQTLDEMCIITHSSAFKESLTFDERFKFHFYGADLCMNAYTAGLDVCALQFECQHKSRNLTGDKTSKSYLEALSMFREKWANFLPIETTTALVNRKQPESAN
jgi:GT2 family glycosyltransferase